MSQPLADMTYCFLGAGSMAEALIRGLTGKAGVPGSRICVTNRSNRERLAELHARYGVRGLAGVEAASPISGADIVVLAMKPKDAGEAISALAPALRPDQLLISVIAGLTLDTMQTLLGRQAAIVRSMPNTPSAIGLGAAGLCFSSLVSPEQQELAVRIFESVGTAAVVEESLMNLVTGVSGSGPAYVYYMIEAMIQAAVEEGLQPEAARSLTVQTVLGAAGMVQAAGEEPGELRRKVTSPGGTTQAALETLDQYQFSQGLAAAIRRAAQRGQEMGGDIRRQALETLNERSESQ